MKVRTILYGPLLLSLFCAIAVPARAQAPNSQQALNQYVVDLQSSPNDTALRGKIIALAQSMRPAPAIPEEARGHYVMATTFAEKAKSDTERAKDSSDLKLASAGFKRAVAEYKAALLAAPWWADAYKKLAIAQKAAEQYDDAIASLNLYLLTQPADARDAQDEIYKLKALKQSAADDAAKRQQEERQRAYESSPAGIAARRQNDYSNWLQKIDGARYVYHSNNDSSGVEADLTIDIRGNTVTQGIEFTRCPTGCGAVRVGEWTKNWQYKFSGRRWTFDTGQISGGKWIPCTAQGEISEDGNSVTISSCSGNTTFNRER